MTNQQQNLLFLQSACQYEKTTSKGYMVFRYRYSKDESVRIEVQEYKFFLDFQTDLENGLRTPTGPAVRQTVSCDRILSKIIHSFL